MSGLLTDLLENYDLFSVTKGILLGGGGLALKFYESEAVDALSAALTTKRVLMNDIAEIPEAVLRAMYARHGELQLLRKLRFMYSLVTVSDKSLKETIVYLMQGVGTFFYYMRTCEEHLVQLRAGRLEYFQPVQVMLKQLTLNAQPLREAINRISAYMLSPCVTDDGKCYGIRIPLTEEDAASVQDTLELIRHTLTVTVGRFVDATFYELDAIRRYNLGIQTPSSQQTAGLQPQTLQTPEGLLAAQAYPYFLTPLASQHPAEQEPYDGSLFEE